MKSRTLSVGAGVLCLGLLCVLGASASRAAPIVYSFEAPVFTLGQTTPLLSEPPDAAGPATFTTAFTDTVDANGYEIVNVPQNGLMVGQALIAPTATSALTLTFNTPVTQLSVNFAIDTSVASPGFLRLVTPSGTEDQTASNVGGGNGFPGGTLTFTTTTPFTTATLQGFITGGASNTQIEIDDLNLTPAVPEPSTLGLLGVGAAALLAWRRRRGTPAN
jgi:hypothetical protein